MKLEIYDNSDFNRGAPRWKRGLWVIVRGVFFQNPCPWGSAFRSALLRLFGAMIGKGVGIGSSVNISFPWRLVMGETTSGSAMMSGFSVWHRSQSNRTFASPDARFFVREATMFGGKISS